MTESGLVYIYLVGYLQQGICKEEQRETMERSVREDGVQLKML